jgi:polysaccharide export outer membrane protein
MTQIDLSVPVSFYRYFKNVIPVLVLCCSVSCVTQREVEYMQDPDTDIKVFNLPEFQDYRLKPTDELYIQIKSLDEGAANFFSNSAGQQNSNMGALDPHLLSYTIDKEGFLLLPVVGNIEVHGRTLSEVSHMLTDSLQNVLNQPVVTVKLINSYVSVLGEVGKPGHYQYSQEKLSVYDALGLAGDITEYGNRDNVILVRNENGENMRANINLTHSDILSSEYYYLRPNDILYVKPLRNKFWGMRQFPWSVFFAAITTGLLIYEIVNNP